MKTITVFTPFLMCLALLNCNQNSDKMELREVVKKAKNAGYNVTYNDTLKVIKPDQSKIADPNMFAHPGGCGLDDDTAFINELIKISKKADSSNKNQRNK
jgi:hypothetical protein